MLATNDTKFCQSCIDRGFNPPNPASREWQTGVYYCDECFMAVINNLTNIAPASVQKVVDSIEGNQLTVPHIDSNPDKEPILPQIYRILNVPKELQFDNIDTTCRNYDKIFNFHAPAVVNRTLEDITSEIEQLGMSIFHIKYKLETLQLEQNRLKEERRKEKNLKSYDDSKEEFSKVKTKSSAIKSTQEEKMAKTLGMSLEAYRKFIAESQEKEKKERERKFNILAGNCPECGGAIPCLEHANIKA